MIYYHLLYKCFHKPINILNIEILSEYNSRRRYYVQLSCGVSLCVAAVCNITAGTFRPSNQILAITEVSFPCCLDLGYLLCMSIIYSLVMKIQSSLCFDILCLQRQKWLMIQSSLLSDILCLQG